jgi:hypothetical protein
MKLKATLDIFLPVCSLILLAGKQPIPINLRQVVVFDKRVRGWSNQEVHMI